MTNFSPEGLKIRQEVARKVGLLNRGKTKSKEARLKMSLAKKGKPPWNKGLKGYLAGSRHYKWIEDRTKIKQYWTERNNPEYKRWKREVFERDMFQCRIKNSDCSGRIEAHHILGWSKFPELRYKINNGITLCHAHHPKTRTDEQKLIPIFKKLAVS